jgi:SAM-dependent methyltransferase
MASLAAARTAVAAARRLTRLAGTHCTVATRSPLRVQPAAFAPAAARHFSRTSWEEGDDVDLDSVAYGFMASQALFSGLELGLFDKIAAGGEKGIQAQEIWEAVGIKAPRVTTLLTALTAVKCLRRTDDGYYTLSPNTARFMVSSSKHYYGDYLQYQIGRQFYHRMGALPDVMTTGKAPSYASWFSDPEVAKTYTQAQHNGSIATAQYLVKKKLELGGIKDMLDVGGGSGAFSYVFTGATPGLKSTVLELPEVCRTGESIKTQQSQDIQDRVQFVELDATSPDWPVSDTSFDMVLMSYISGSVPEGVILPLYKNAFKALRPGGRLLVHDFMVDDSLAGPALGALWGLQHVTVNASGLGLCPAEIINRMSLAGFDGSKCETVEMIHGMTKLIVAHKS